MVFLFGILTRTLENNTVNGKPLVYLEGVANYSVGDAGQVILVRCGNISVENLNLTVAVGGSVQLLETNNSIVSGNNILTASNVPNLFSTGIYLASSFNNSIGRNNITNNHEGIWLYSSFNNSICGNSLENNDEGIALESSSRNNIGGNNIANSFFGVSLIESSFKNSVSGNNITNNEHGIMLDSSSNNAIYHNNLNNTIQVYSLGSNNVWDDGYPSGGNYWSDYNGTDLYSGPYQNETSNDGIGDVAYTIDANNTDRYPLMAPYGMSTFVVNLGGSTGPINVGVMTNSTVTNVQVDEVARTLSFNVSGPTGTSGYCRITLPNIIVQSLWNGNYTVLMNGEPWPYTNSSDSENTYIYINYTHSQHQIVIIPEFPSLPAILPSITATLLAVTVYKKKRST